MLKKKKFCEKHQYDWTNDIHGHCSECWIEEYTTRLNIPRERICCPSHCCKKHGCKYGHDDCPVEFGHLAGVQCESCRDEEEERHYYAETYHQSVSEDELKAFVRKNMRITVEDSSTSDNYEVRGSLGVTVKLWLNDECISSDSCSIG